MTRSEKVTANIGTIILVYHGVCANCKVAFRKELAGEPMIHENRTPPSKQGAYPSLGSRAEMLTRLALLH